MLTTHSAYWGVCPWVNREPQAVVFDEMVQSLPNSIFSTIFSILFHESGKKNADKNVNTVFALVFTPGHPRPDPHVKVLGIVVVYFVHFWEVHANPALDCRYPSLKASASSVRNDRNVVFMTHFANLKYWAFRIFLLERNCSFCQLPAFNSFLDKNLLRLRKTFVKTKV